MVIQDSRMPDSKIGTVSDEFTLNIDLAPTLLGAAKIPASDFMQGRDISSLYPEGREGAKSWCEDLFYEHTVGADTITGTGFLDKSKVNIPASFALVTKEWKYILYMEVWTCMTKETCSTYQVFKQRTRFPWI